MRLYHYCSLQTFSAIIDSKTLRLSDISKSNDSMELIYGLDIIEETLISSFIAGCKSAMYFRKKTDENLFKKVVADWKNELIKEKAVVCYAICFSREKDLLSQWRGYASDGAGVSIGIDREILTNPSGGKFKLGRVIYDKRIQRGKARKIADRVIKSLKIVAKQAIVTKEDILTVLNLELTAFMDAMATYKSYFFKEEKEWRLYCCSKKSSPLDGKIVFGVNDCKKVIDFRFSRFGTSDVGLHVRLGPKCKASIEDIEEYMHYHGISGSVKKSEGSYR